MILEIADIDIYYGAVQALQGLSLRVQEGECVTLIGANGAGKSTTLRTVSGLVRAQRGQILFRGTDITNKPPHKIVSMGISHALEGRQVFPGLTVVENLEMGAYTRADKDQVRQTTERVFAIFPRLKERLGQLGGTLSGGEQQMLSMGRALMSNPTLLLLDEPSFGLSPALVEQIYDVIKEINQGGTSILLVEQNAVMALAVATRGYVLETGKIVLEGTAAELAENPKVRAAYLGES
jgi:branched-chain amino acid transport system ATP-binding protein